MTLLPSIKSGYGNPYVITSSKKFRNVVNQQTITITIKGVILPRQQNRFFYLVLCEKSINNDSLYQVIKIYTILTSTHAFRGLYQLW